MSATSLSLVVGANVRRLRGNAPMSALAQRVPGWNTSEVAKIEGGNRRVTVPVLARLIEGLAAVRGEPVSMIDLFLFADPIQLAEGVEVENSTHLLDVLSGRRRLPKRDSGSKLTEGESRVARSLGLRRADFIEMCEGLWGKSFEDERDARAGVGANAQKRGRISREMKQELAAIILNISQKARG